MNRTAMFASPLKEKLAFYSMSGREALSRPFVYEVDLLSEDDSLDLLALLGKPAKVGLERTDGSIREFNGYVTHFALVGEHANHARYRAVLRPWLWFLGQNQSSRVYQPETVPNIVEALFRERGFSDFETHIAVGDYRKWDYPMQYRESDLNFVSRLLEHEGIHYFFRHEGGKHILVMADSNTAHKTNPGYETVPYFPPMERERRQEEHVDTWITSRQIRPGAMTAVDFDFKQPAIVGANSTAPLLKPEPANAEIYDYPAGLPIEIPEGAEDHDPSTDADMQARIRLEEHQVEHELIQGGGPVRGLGAGTRFTLSQFPRHDQNKEYVIQSASYELRVSEFESSMVEDVETNFAFQFTALDAKRAYRPPRITKKPVVEGPQTAIVVGDGSNEIYTDEYGRVKLQFHWDREGTQNQKSSGWVRVSQAWAGMQWGSVHLPRVGQEVIVEFLEGDPDRPIVTGRVYNAAQMPPYALPDNRTQSGIKSRSSPDGGPTNFNEIRFEDLKDSEELFIQAEKDLNTLVKNDQYSNIKHDREALVEHNDILTVNGDCQIHVIGNLAFQVDGKGDGAGPIKSSMAVTGAHNMNASDSVSISAPNKISLSVGGSSIVLEPGKITIASGGKAQIVLDANVAATSSAGSVMVLDANAALQASGKAQLVLDANVLAKSNDGSKIVLDANAAAEASGGGKLTLDANATIKGGSVKIN